MALADEVVDELAADPGDVHGRGRKCRAARVGRRETWREIKSLYCSAGCRRRRGRPPQAAPPPVARSGARATTAPLRRAALSGSTDRSLVNCARARSSTCLSWGWSMAGGRCATARLALAAALVLACGGAFAADPAKRLRLAISDIDSLDPQQWQSASANDVGYAIFEALYDWNYLASIPDLAPRTAASLPEISPDGKVWTIRIQPQILFTDHPAFGGKPRELVAQDYVYSIKRTLDPNLRRGGSPIYSDLIVGMRAVVDAARKPGAKFDYDAPVEGLRALDRYTLQLRLNAPNHAAMRSLLQSAAAVAREVVDALHGDVQAQPVGTGPYRLKEWRHGSRVVLEANPAYRTLAFPQGSDPAVAGLVREMQGRPLPQVGLVELSIIEEMQPRVLAFQRGELDIAMLRGSGALALTRNGALDPALAARGVRRDTYHYTTRMALFNMEDPVVGGFSQQHVALRRAIALSLDIDKMVSVVYGGEAAPANQLLARGAAGYDTARPAKRTMDRALANALLDRVGYGRRDGQGFRVMPDGKPLALTLTTFTGAQWREMQTLWRQDMDAIGVRMEFRAMPATDVFKEASQGNFQLVLIGNTSSPMGLDLLSLHSKEPGSSNAARFRHEPFDRALERFMYARTEPQRLAEARVMNEIVDSYAPVIPLVVELETAYIQPWVLGFRGSPYVTFYYQYLDVDPARRKALGAQ
ncbi:MAG: ABC transporter substrate-binding protein [Burkholderiales bacterium]